MQKTRLSVLYSYSAIVYFFFFFFFQAEDGIRDLTVTGVQTCALPICDKNYPIWTGCWYGSSSEVPTLALGGRPDSPNILLQTTGQHTVLLSDLPGGPGITLRTASGAMLVINDSGILITNGQGASISLNGNTVTVNQGALVVT